MGAKAFTVLGADEEVAAGLRDVPESHSIFLNVSAVLEGPAHHSALAVDQRMVVILSSSGTKARYSIWRTR